MDGKVLRELLAGFAEMTHLFPLPFRSLTSSPCGSLSKGASLSGFTTAGEAVQKGQPLYKLKMV